MLIKYLKPQSYFRVMISLIMAVVISLSFPAFTFANENETEEIPAKEGIIFENGVYYYYVDGEIQKNAGWALPSAFSRSYRCSKGSD